PGEHVEVKNDQLYIDGKEKDEYFLNSNDEEVNTEDFTLESLPGNYKEIPEGKVFVLGDNRHNSTDSRVMGLRSEEHTSELQSRFDLVCRLLLEKKKNTQ